ncbi:mitogen-activated protein kinase kinase kinase 17-like [Solanum pennellii]|uniref:Mitogen-activated protein kinase kinase kinase 17-like n=1 Tax=Solanum pennellii TaxID=28526 RepID=A0ABM1H7S2_SOLPN|nr:mitogen-activated protein kinase kinase kinase 17-like [Solanum pennellii]
MKSYAITNIVVGSVAAVVVLISCCFYRKKKSPPLTPTVTGDSPAIPPRPKPLPANRHVEKREDFTVEKGNIIYNILLEYARGSLSDRLNSGRGLEENEVKQYAKSILLGIREVHNRGFIHCDIKPSNVLLVAHADTGKVTAKIADFGVALHQSQCKTTNGRLRGTVLYMAPEVVLEDKYGPQVDIWSFGCTVFEMITGKPIWELDELCIIRMESPDLQNSKLSRLAVDFLRKCLVRDHRARWTSGMLLQHPFLSSFLLILFVCFSSFSKKKSASRCLIENMVYSFQ